MDFPQAHHFYDYCSFSPEAFLSVLPPLGDTTYPGFLTFSVKVTPVSFFFFRARPAGKR